jgi:hypothetical protein
MFAHICFGDLISPLECLTSPLGTLSVWRLGYTWLNVTIVSSENDAVVDDVVQRTGGRPKKDLGRETGKSLLPFARVQKIIRADRASPLHVTVISWDPDSFTC